MTRLVLLCHLFLVVLIAIPSVALANECPLNGVDDYSGADAIIKKTPDHFIECKKDSDCVHTFGICGNPRSINEDNLTCFNEAAMIAGTITDCEFVEQKVGAPKCIEGMCGFAESGDAGSE